MNLLQPCFGLSALYEYLPTPDPARRPGITPLPYTKHVLRCYSWFNSQRRRVAPPLSYLGMLFMYGLTGNQ